MQEIARIPLPAHDAGGEFDHAAPAPTWNRLFVAHPSNDAVEAIDLAARRHLRTLPGLRGVAGVWVGDAEGLLFTSNRGEHSASIFRLEGGRERELHRIPTGVRPNGMAFDRRRGTLMVAGVGDAKRPDAPPSLTFADADSGRVLQQIAVPGRTRWALYHAPTDAFYVNIADPALIVRIDATDLDTVGGTYSVPAQGPHGLEQSPDGYRLYCACDEGLLIELDLESERFREVGRLSGAPDVLWIDPRKERLYAAVGEAGCVDVFGIGSGDKVESVLTGRGAHTLTVDPQRSELHVFLPESHEDLVLGE